VDPTTGNALWTWDDAMAVLDADPNQVPAHVVRLGRIEPGA
jgi:hypothetical protein